MRAYSPLTLARSDAVGVVAGPDPDPCALVGAGAAVVGVPEVAPGGGGLLGGGEVGPPAAALGRDHQRQRVAGAQQRQLGVDRPTRGVHVDEPHRAPVAGRRGEAGTHPHELAEGEAGHRGRRLGAVALAGLHRLDPGVADVLGHHDAVAPRVDRLRVTVHDVFDHPVDGAALLQPGRRGGRCDRGGRGSQQGRAGDQRQGRCTARCGRDAGTGLGCWGWWTAARPVLMGTPGDVAGGRSPHRHGSPGPVDLIEGRLRRPPTAAAPSRAPLPPTVPDAGPLRARISANRGR